MSGEDEEIFENKNLSEKLTGTFVYGFFLEFDLRSSKLTWTIAIYHSMILLSSLAAAEVSETLKFRKTW